MLNILREQKNGQFLFPARHLKYPAEGGTEIPNSELKPGRFIACPVILCLGELLADIL